MPAPRQAVAVIFAGIARPEVDWLTSSRVVDNIVAGLAAPTTTPRQTEEVCTIVDNEKAKGRAEQLKGKVEQAVGKATGSEETQARGEVHEAKGKVREKVADVKGKVKKWLDDPK